MNTFGDNLREIRVSCKLSQKKFANLIGTTQQRVSEWENNKVEPTLGNIYKMIKYLHTTFEELTDGIQDF